MKLINQSVEIWQQPEGEVGIYKQVEKAARLCYKSEDKVTEDSYKRFINMLDERKHRSPYEHGTVYLQVPLTEENEEDFMLYDEISYSSLIFTNEDTVAITTNYRVIKEHGWECDLKYLCEPTEYHVKRISVHITTSRSISHELVRHRVFSFCQESQRYCAYNKGKFGGEVTFINPCWDTTTADELITENGTHKSSNKYEFVQALQEAEDHYLSLLAKGWKPQQAREILPNATKTELVMTGFVDDWREFFKLRCSPAAHPMMQELANMIKAKFIELGYITV